VGHRVLAGLLDRCDPRQQLGLRVLRQRADLGQLRLTLGERAGLVEQHAVDLIAAVDDAGYEAKPQRESY
jgi:hypothetical protein